MTRGVLMRLKWIALTVLLGMIVVLDPTHLMAQFGPEGGRRESPAPDGAPAVVVAPPGGAPSAFPSPGGGFPGRGDRGSGDRGSGDRGSGDRVPGRGMDPERTWSMLQRDTKSSGDTLDLSKMSPQMRGMNKMISQRMGTPPLPETGMMTKEQFLQFTSANAEKMGVTAPAGPMAGSPGGDRGADRLREQDKDRDGRVSFAEADSQLKPNFQRIDRNGDGFVTLDEYRGYYAAQNNAGRDQNIDKWGGGDQGAWSGTWGNRRQDQQKDAEEAKPVAMRYGHLPKDLPDWFDADDVNKDGQIALHEWRKADKPIAEFNSYDMNGDGLVTADEYLRFGRRKAEDARMAAFQEGISPPATRPSLAGNSGGRGFGNSGRGNDASSSEARPVPGAGSYNLPGSTPTPVPASTDRGSGRSEKSDRSDKGDKSSDKPNPFQTGGKKNRN